jgi:hypothetical protein
MQIKDLFVRDIFRPINGVVKADQHDEAIVWQELDEYVVTRELDKHFRQFFDAYLAAIDNPKDPVVTSRMGVWVSGFFGSGKSHFIKILSYLLNNYHAHNTATAESKEAVHFFEKKIEDVMLLSDIKRTVSENTDVVLFNIDSKADNKDGKDAILSVFLRVFNEMQGFSGDAPHIANLERELSDDDLLETFQKSFQEASGKEWVKNRDAFGLYRDEVIHSLSKTRGMSEESATKWFDEAEEKNKMNIESFAKLVKKYLDSKGPAQRIIFLADEVGQFIGQDTHLMLNLQTITEDLGRICGGRAWIIVTSQEDIDAVLGEVRGGRANDFSKIQGRFPTRILLSSANTDEVIQARLLEKKDNVKQKLEDLYGQKGDILKNQLSFSNNGATLKNFRDKDDFVINYPFAPYHFQLLQKVFESIRKAGATGKHLAMGERSMLDAFQSAAKNISAKNIGALVPLYEFYPAIESFLDTIVRRTIDQAKDNAGLEPFDGQLLRILFLIRYVDIIKSNVDNLVTLCIDEVDTDRLALKRKIEEALVRLEKETLISRNGDLYFYLTDEERSVSREIKNLDIAGSEVTKTLSELIFQDVFKDDNKCRYQLNKKDYGFNRICDTQPHGNISQELGVEVITPLHDEFSGFNTPKCILQSTADGGRVLIKLPDRIDLGRELRTYVQTSKYIHLKSDAAAPESLKKILRDRADENRERKARLIQMLEEMIIEGDYYASGQSLEQKSAAPKMALYNSVSYLIKNIYTKLGYLDALQEDPLKEIRAVLMSNDIGQYKLELEGTEGNAQALKEMKQFVDLSMVKNQSILLDELVGRFSGRPYGWPELEVILLIARLFVAGEIKLMLDGAAIMPADAIEPLSKSVKWKQVKVIKRKAIASQELDVSRNLGQKVFGQIGPESEDSLYTFVSDHLAGWAQLLKSYQPLADTGKYPGKTEIDAGCTIIDKLIFVADSYEFFQAFNAKKEDLAALSEDVHELKDFYSNQRATWEKLQNAINSIFKPNRQELEKDPSSKQALTRMDEILSAKRPYGMIKEVEGLVNTVSAVNETILAKHKTYTTQALDIKINKVMEALDHYNAEPDLRNKTLKPLQDIKKHVQQETSVPGIFYQTTMANDEFEKSIELIEAKNEKVDSKKPAKPVKIIKPANFSTKNYLETEDDIKEFIEALRKELEVALREHARIRIL